MVFLAALIMKTTYCLVYQAGIANVFEEDHLKDSRSESGFSLERIRVLQSDFKTCESYCRGLRRAKKTVRTAWCNEAGDIINSNWHFFNFEDAPFCHSFASDFANLGLDKPLNIY